MIKMLLLIAAGGAVGAVLRYAVAGVVQAAGGSTFPLGTLVVNVIGCLAIGIVGAYFAGPHLVREEHRAIILVGLLGAFTTFSTFGWETFELVNDRQWLLAGANVLLSNVVGLGAVWLGYRLAENWGWG